MRMFLWLVFLVSTQLGLAQVKVPWSTLEGVNYSYVQNMDQNFWYGEPTYDEAVKALEGQVIQVKGYVLPLDLSGDNYVLSAFPFSSCFFCGGAGQESVIELRLADSDARFKQDQYLTFTGKLKLNHRELELNYLLEDARPLTD
jgi:hypothetical protein